MLTKERLATTDLSDKRAIHLNGICSEEISVTVEALVTLMARTQTMAEMVCRVAEIKAER